MVTVPCSWILNGFIKVNNNPSLRTTRSVWLIPGTKDIDVSYCNTDPSFILLRFASVKSRAVEVLISDVHLMVVPSIT